MKLADFKFADQIPGEIVEVQQQQITDSLERFTVTFFDTTTGEQVTGVFEASQEWSAEGWGYEEKTEEFTLFQRVA